MKKHFKFCCAFLPVAALGFTSLSSCSHTTESYKLQDVDLYYDIGKSKKIPIRFFLETPNVPYIGVNQFFHEFFETNLLLEKKGDIYTYYHPNNPGGDFLRFSKGLSNTFMTTGLKSFDDHPRSITATSKLFVGSNEQEGSFVDVTSKSVFAVSLDNYSIKIHGDNSDAYVPLTFLSDMCGAFSAYNVAYNGRNIYIYDHNGYVQDKERTYDTYYSDGYFNEIANFETERPADLAKYVYNQLCFTFDNLRGYTSQLFFGDNNLVSIGLNGLLEAHHPRIKEYLLSTDKRKYLQGLQALFSGLYDGGHTGILYPRHHYQSNVEVSLPRIEEISEELTNAFSNSDFNKIPSDLSSNLCRQSYLNQFYSNAVGQILTMAKIQKLGLKQTDYNENNGFYYKAFPDQKIAFIGFNEFSLEFDGWDRFYNGEGEEKVELADLIPRDSYAFIRDKLIQAKNDGVNKIILDLSANGGGSVASLCGIVGLFNKAKCQYNVNNTMNRYRESTNYTVDINLDGQYNEQDSIEAKNMLDGLNVAVLTSVYSFSCGNLLPCVLHEVGLPIIGQQSGGGSCAIMSCTTADGIFYVHSSYACLSDSNGNNIDSGVTPDLAIPPLFVTEEGQPEPNPNFFDPTYLSGQLDKIFTNN